METFFEKSIFLQQTAKCILMNMNLNKYLIVWLQTHDSQQNNRNNQEVLEMENSKLLHPKLLVE